MMQNQKNNAIINANNNKKMDNEREGGEEGKRNISKKGKN